MKDNVDIQILHMNYVQFLITYLEGRTTLPTLFQVNERICNRDPKTLSQPLILATTAIHELKKRMDREEVHIDTIVDTINYATQVLTTITNKKYTEN